MHDDITEEAMVLDKSGLFIIKINKMAVYKYFRFV